jgi:hypothetical protein
MPIIRVNAQNISKTSKNQTTKNHEEVPNSTQDIPNDKAIARSKTNPIRK